MAVQIASQAGTAVHRVRLPQVNSPRLWSVLVLLNAILHQGNLPQAMTGMLSISTCPTGQTLKLVNFTTTCVNCTACGPGQEPSSSCAPRQDTVCTACPPGTFSNTTSSSSRCHVCTRQSFCHFLKLRQRNCTASQDTNCDECGEGYYKSTEASSCLPCTTCLADEEESRPCTLATDRKCSAKLQRNWTDQTDLTLPTLYGHATSQSWRANSTLPPTDQSNTDRNLTHLVTDPSPDATASKDGLITIAIYVSPPLIVALFVCGYFLKRYCSSRSPPPHPDYAERDKSKTITRYNTAFCIRPHVDPALFSQKLESTSEGFREELCSILSQPDTKSGKDWRMLLKAFRVDEQEFSPWMDDDKAKETKAAQLLLKKLAGKDVEELHSKLSQMDLDDAASFVHKADLRAR